MNSLNAPVVGMNSDKSTTSVAVVASDNFWLSYRN